jgi:WD40 repeat protein
MRSALPLVVVAFFIGGGSSSDTPATAHARDAKEGEGKGGAEETLTALSDGGGTVVSMKAGTRTLVRVDNTAKEKASRLKLELGMAEMLAVTPDGKLAVVGNAAKIAVVRFAPEPAVQMTCRVAGGLSALATCPRGKVVAVGGDSKRVVLLDAKTGKEVRTLKHDEEITGLCFSPDGKMLAVGTIKGKCVLWVIDVGKTLWEASLGKSRITSIAFFPDGKRIAAGGWNTNVHVIDAGGGKSLASYSPHRSMLNHLAVSHDGKYVASCGLDKCLHVWDVVRGKTFGTVNVGFTFPTAVFSKDKVVVAEGTVTRLFDLKTKKLTDARDLQ